MFFVLISSLLLGACSCDGGGGVIDLPKDVRLYVTVSSNIVHVGDVVKVTCTTEGANRTENNIGASTGISWTYDLVIQGKTKIVINAFGAGTPANYEITIDVYPVIISTMKDSLAAHGWKLVRRQDWKISTNTVSSYYELSAVQLSDITRYTLDNYVKIFHAGETTAYTSGPYSLVGKTLTSGDQIKTIALLTDSTLQIDQIDRYTADTVIRSFYEAVP